MAWILSLGDPSSCTSDSDHDSVEKSESDDDVSSSDDENALHYRIDKCTV